MIKYDNCKNCFARCEHAGKDREFICPGGKSCKVTRTTFTVCPEGCKWLEVEAATAEMAYRSVCSLYSPATRILIVNQATGQAVTFTRQLDGAGNLVRISQE